MPRRREFGGFLLDPLRMSGRGRCVLVLALAVSLGACESRPSAEAGPRAAPDRSQSTVSAVDDAGRTVTLPRPARRIVSLLPAATETLFALGAGDLVVGRTRYDTDSLVSHLPSVGGGLDPSLEALVALAPDLVVTWEPASGGSRVRTRLEQMGIPVFSVQTRDTADIFRNIENLGRLTGRPDAAVRLAASVRAEIDSVRGAVPPGARPTVLFVVAVDPPMVAGLDNFIAELIEVAGGEPLEIAGPARGLSPQVSLEELIRLQPDIVILPVGEHRSITARRLSSEPGWSALRAVREGRVVEMSADLVNRPGPRIGETARALRAALDQAAATR